ncbi:hypothetical protein D6827_01185 [Candidatus Parcubacteria bacterium]|nr:MAG: hypothetical protein D6827_01185 [Candidatus Parcubacteria bacterium]
MNADKTNPSVKLKLGDKEYELRFTLGALRKLEKETGKNAFDGSALANPSASDITALIWAGLRNCELSIDEVGDLIDIKDLPVLTEKLQQAFAVAMPDSTQGAAEKNDGDQSA